MTIVMFHRINTKPSLSNFNLASVALRSSHLLSDETTCLQQPVQERGHIHTQHSPHLIIILFLLHSSHNIILLRLGSPIGCLECGGLLAQLIAFCRFSPAVGVFRCDPDRARFGKIFQRHRCP